MTEPSLRTLPHTLPAAFQRGDDASATKALEAVHVVLLQDIVAAIARCDYPAFEAHLAPEVELEIYAPSDFPFTRRAQGAAAVREAVVANFSKVEEQHPTVLSLVAQGDTVIMLGREEGRLRSTGRSYAVHFVQQFTFRDGQLLAFREIVGPIQ